MKLSNDAFNILKHATVISPGIKIDAGTEIFSAHESGAVRMYSQLTPDDNFPVPFTVMNLNQFLNMVSLVDEPNLDFTEDSVNITSKDGGTTVKYYYSDPSTVNQDNKRLKADLTYEVEFFINQDDLSKLFKAASAISADDICVYNKKGDVYIAAVDKRCRNSNRYDLFVLHCDDLEKNGYEFKIYFRKSNLKLTNNDFTVSISSKGISVWKATNANVPNLTFYVAIERDSEFSGKDD